jgi:hypothetical protein
MCGNQIYLSGFRALEGVTMTHFSNADGVQVNHLSGETGDRYQGWISTGYLQTEPAPAIGFSCRANGEFVAVTVLRIAARKAQDDSWVKDGLLSDIAQLDWAAEPLAALKRVVTHAS